MCGIAGIITQSHKAPLSEVIDPLSHRGPDDYGWLVWNSSTGIRRGKTKEIPPGQVTFGHRRLSIIDLSQNGHQPMSTPDGRYHIVYNGEVYNYKELRFELKQKGIQFSSSTDSEVVLASYAYWGEKCLARFKGMFAFAILDIEEKQIFLARDFFGIKPLYYCAWQEGIAFGSEIPPLLKLPGISRRINGQRVYDYLLAGMTDHGSETMFDEVKQIPAAHLMEINIERLQIKKIKRYWHLDLSETLDISFKEAAQKLKELFLGNVALHLRSDVPVGTALSGGIDSSAIVCAIRYLQPGTELHTFSYVADDKSLSEEHWVDIVTTYAQTDTHKIKTGFEDLVKNLDDFLYNQGEPFGSTSIFAQYKVFSLARENGVKVMLDGQGADELLAGYPTYQGTLFASMIKQGRWDDALKFLRRAFHDPERSMAYIIKLGMRNLIPSGFVPFARKMLGQGLNPEWLKKEWFQNNDVQMYSLMDFQCKKLCLREALSRTMEVTSLPGLLRYEDRNSMGHSIESRVPFLSPDMAEFVFKLPEEYILDQNGISKSVFREAMRGIVPDSILDRRDKIGFVTPEKQWLERLNPWVQKTLGEGENLPFLYHEKLLNEWKAMLAGRRAFSYSFWRWINLIKWVNMFDVDTGYC